jgi:DNA-directed RNA polymerase subunit alpha
MIREYEGEYIDALECYEKALALDPDDPRTMFRCAFLYDLHGDDAQGVELYERLALQPAAHVNALMNLVVLYEDQGKYEEAAECLQRILAANPNHVRARLFLKDVESGRTMHIDEAQIEAVDTQARQLETPISEFELSVRARNCLKKMNIHTLGDLLRTSEAELLAYKNFGETSLTEIKELLSKCEVDLGQPLDPAAPAPAPAAAPAPGPVALPTPPPVINVPPGSQAALSKPVSQLELSVRARKCLQRLNISTIGALIRHTEAQLMAIRNFGMTSLVEIKGRLSDIGLTLAGAPDSESSASNSTL